MNPKLVEKIVFSILFLATLLVVALVLLILALIVIRGSGMLSWEFLTSMPKMGMRAGGIFPVVAGTFYLVIGTLVFALPVGIFSAIYLSEYSKRGLLTRLIEIAIVNLAGVPSVVYGLFGLGLFVGFLKLGVSILAGSLTLSGLVLPVVI